MKPRLITTISLTMAVFSWLGLGYLVLSYPPDTMGRVLFLSLLFLAASFTCAPLLLAVHGRAAATMEEAARRQGLALAAGFCCFRLLSWRPLS